MKLTKKGTAGFAAGVILGAAGGAYTGPSDEEITQKVDAQVASKIIMTDAVHRPIGTCLACHSPEK